MIQNLHREKILIVDDNPENIWPLIENLETEYEIQFATDGEKALNIAFSNDRPDLILLDIIMPGMNGYEVCSKLKIREYTKDIPVIFLSAKTEERDETRGLELGAQDYITKPFSMSVVRARIKSVLALKREMERRQLLKKQIADLNAQLEHQVRTKMKELREAQETLRSYEEKYNNLFHPKKFAEAETRSKILVVDDQPGNIHILMEHLEAEYEVLFATNGEKALDIAFSGNPPDLVLLDIMMPDMDGYEVCSTLKGSVATRDIPVIFITAHDQEEDETRGFRLGAADFITKPFRMPIVEARIKAILRLKEEMNNRMVLARRLEDLNKNLEERIQKKTTELAQAHENLMVSEKQYRTIFENAIEGIFWSTPEGRYLSASPSLARLLGYESPQEIISTTTDIAHQIYVRPEDRTEYCRTLEEKGEISGFETRLRKKNGDIIWVMISAKVIHDEKGKPLYYQGFNLDITEQKRARELELANIRLRELNALKSAMMSTASHDLRSPLTSILGLTDVIKSYFSKHFMPHLKGNSNLEAKAEKSIVFLETIKKEGERLIRLINNFLDLSKVESGCSEWHDRPIRITGIIDQAVNAIKGQLLEKNGVEFEIACGDDLPVITCDPDRMMQIMVNLLSNAAKFTEAGSIRIRALSVPEEMIEVRVTDSGPGIPDEEQEKIFDKFYQIKQNGKFEKKTKGTGLGLSICKQIIEHYGGKIWVESESGHGSTFIFRFPVGESVQNRDQR